MAPHWVSHHEAEFELRPKVMGLIGISVVRSRSWKWANFFPYVFEHNLSLGSISLKTNLARMSTLQTALTTRLLSLLRNQDKPFFCISVTTLHTILNGRPDLVEKYIRKHKPGPVPGRIATSVKILGKRVSRATTGLASQSASAAMASIDGGIGMIDRKLREWAWITTRSSSSVVMRWRN